MLKNQNLLDLTFCEKLWKITGKKFNICWIPLQSNLMFPVTSKKKLTSTKYQNILHMEGNFYEVQTTKCTKTLYQTDTIRPLVFQSPIALELFTLLPQRSVHYNTAI